MSTYNNNKVWVRRHTDPNVSTYKHKSVQKSTPYKDSTRKGRHSHINMSTHKSRTKWARQHFNDNRSTHNYVNNMKGRHSYYDRSTYFLPRSTHESNKSTHMSHRLTHMTQRSTHQFNRSTHMSHRLTHLQNNQGYKPFKFVMRVNINEAKSHLNNKNNEYIYNTKVQLKNQISKSISIK